MKKQTQRKSTRSSFTLLRPLCNPIPNPQLAQEHALQPDLLPSIKLPFQNATVRRFG